MKSVIVILSFLLCFLASPNAWAQKLSKAEKAENRARAKELKAEFKAYYKDLDKFKEFKTELRTIRSRSDSLATAYNNLETEKALTKAQIDSLELANKTLRAELDQQKRYSNQVRASVERNQEMQIPSEGTFYALEIGAADLATLRKVYRSSARPSERKQLGYRLALFKSRSEAEQLQQYVWRMGIRQVKVVKYHNGNLGEP